MDTQMLIGSRFEKGTEAEELVLNPKTGGMILDLPEASEAQINSAVDAAEKAFATWSRTTPAQRSGYLIAQAHRHMRDRAAAELRPVGVEPRDFGVLSTLQREQPCRNRVRNRIDAVVKDRARRIGREIPRSRLSKRHRNRAREE